MMVIGGYSVLGESVLTPLENLESETTLVKLNEAKKELAKSKLKKVDHHGWLSKFKDRGSEIEHEAFLVLWLSRFVFPSSYTTVVQNVYPIAVHLARGLRIALAPAVLASIYRDLSLLKAKLVDSANSKTNDETLVTVWAPLQVVQIWIWERFEKLRPKVSDTEASNTKFGRWDKKKLHMDRKGSFLDCDLEDFCWRPYANHDMGDEEKGRWVDLGDCLDEEMESWGRCLRVSELVGIQGKCVHQYLPHRVAMQFGMDQDIPGDVPRNNASPELAWSFYTRLLTDVKLYLPSRLSEPYVTVRYMEWRSKSTGINSLPSPIGSNETKTFVRDESRTERSKDYVDGKAISDVSQNGESSGSERVNVSGFDLEARIVKLEEVFAYLKAKKYGHRLV